jgi:hypothetical protein
MDKEDDSPLFLSFRETVSLFFSDELPVVDAAVTGKRRTDKTDERNKMRKIFGSTDSLFIVKEEQSAWEVELTVDSPKRGSLFFCIPGSFDH